MKNVFGRVAGVAKGVFQELNAAQPEDDEELEALLQQISEARHAGERRDAMARLKELLLDNPRAQMAMGSMGIPVLLAVLQEDRDDVDLVRGALEALLHTFAFDADAVAAANSRAAAQHSGALPAREVPAPPGLINAQLFARSADNSALLLSLLEDEPLGIPDFYVRYHTLQLLTVLLHASPHKLQEAVLRSPLGVVRLMDCLSEREVIRNEALLLLVPLTRTNAEVQKIAVFEGAFERALAVIREEGCPAGGAVVVADALALLANLLRGNLANQRLFREMGHIKQLPALLAYTPPPQAHEALMAAAGAAAGSMAATAALSTLASGGSSILPPQVAANLLAALEAARLLLAAPAVAAPPEERQQQGANRAANQAVLAQLGVMGQLLALGLEEGGLPSTAVRAQAMFCLGDLVAQSPANQSAVAAAAVRQRGVPLPVLQAALGAALHSGDAKERAGARHVLAAFCGGNAQGQAMLAGMLAPPGAQDGAAANGESFGEDLLRTLLGAGGAGSAGLAQVARAAGVLVHLLEGNDAAKQRLLAVPQAGEPLLPRCMRYLGEALRSGPSGTLPALLLLRLLVCWLHSCPAAVDALLRGPANLPLLVDGANGRLGGGDVDVAGLSVVLLGVCLLHAPRPPQPPNVPPHPSSSNANSPAAQLVLDVLLSRVGISQFCGRIEDLKKGRLFLAAQGAPTLQSNAQSSGATGLGSAADGHAQHAASNGTAASPSHTGHRISGGSADSEEDNPYDASFVQLVEQVEAAVKAQTLDAFNSGASSDGPGAAAGPGPPGARLPATAEEVAAQLPGAGPGEKLAAALQALLRLQQEVAELQQRNRALAQDLIRVSSSASSPAVAAPAQGQQQQQGPGVGGSSSSADADARMAAQLRASRAEMEAGTLRQQLAAMNQRWGQLEAQLSAAHSAAEEAKAAAAKAEQDLGDLSAAYNSLEQHCHGLEAQLHTLQEQQQDGASSGGAGVAVAVAAAVAKAREEAAEQLRALEAQQAQRVQEAVQQALAGEHAKHGPAATSTAGGMLSAAEAAARAEAAAAEARAAAEAEGEEQLTDLLVCLGQEEAKVAALSERLSALGVDVDELLASVAAQEAEAGEDELM